MNFDFRSLVEKKSFADDLKHRLLAIQENHYNSLSALTEFSGEAVPSLIQSNLAERVKNLSPRPTELSVLFATVHEILTTNSRCRPQFVGNDGWPCASFYESDILRYAFHDYVLNVSAMPEDAEGVSTRYYYVSFSIVGHMNAYRVIWIPQYSVLKLTDACKMEDVAKIPLLIDAVQGVFIEFIVPFVKKKGKYFRKRELSSYALEPVFDDLSDSPQKKKRRTESTSSSTCDSREEPQSSVYKELMTLIEKKPPNAVISNSGKLFASIFRTLISSYGCQTQRFQNEWPGGFEYKNEAVTFHFPHYTITKDESGHGNLPFHAFKVSIISNKTEFFCVLRAVYTDNVSIQKISPKVIPSFDKDQSGIDDEKFFNISLFISSFVSKFLRPCMKGTLKSSGATTPTSGSFTQESEEISTPLEETLPENLEDE